MTARTTQAATIAPIAPVERFEAAAAISSRLASENDVGDALGADDGLGIVVSDSVDDVCSARRITTSSTKQLAAGSMQSYPFPPHTYSAQGGESAVFSKVCRKTKKSSYM